MLYIVPTPVGNLDDMTFRAVSVLKEADLILAEDTRTSSVLLKHFDIHTPMQSHHKYNEHSTVRHLAERLEAGEDIALISDAGTPGISDPGFMLVRECRKAGVEVTVLPGATAFVPALVGSGLPCDRFVFEGFLPLKKGRATRLAQLAEAFGEDREACVAREISKKFETFHSGSLKELSDHFAANTPRGEIVIVVKGKE